MSDTYYRDREIRFVLVLYSRVEIYIGDNNETPPVVVGDTLQEVIKQFDKWCANHHIGSEVRNND